MVRALADQGTVRESGQSSRSPLLAATFASVYTRAALGNCVRIVIVAILQKMSCVL